MTSTANVRVLGSDETVPLGGCTPVAWAGVDLYRTPGGRLLGTAFRGYAADLGVTALPDPDDEEAAGELILRWVEQVRARDWSDLRGVPLEAEGDWLDLRTTMLRAGWGPAAARAAWEACRERPYSRDLPTAAGWAAAGWVVPAAPDEPDPAFARPVLESRGLLRWVYITRWADPVPLPDTPLPTEPEPADLGWADVLSRLRQDHYTVSALEEAAALAVELLAVAGLAGPDADEPLPDEHLAGACEHHSPLVRASAWFLLADEADAWLACTYGECQHHWAVEAEEEAFTQEEVLELAGLGVSDPVDAAYQRRRLLTMAFGDISDVALAGAGDLSDFLDFYREWVASGRPEETFEQAARDLRGDEDA
jgi:hypothetical protein